MFSDKSKSGLFNDIQANREGAKEHLRDERRFREEMDQMLPSRPKRQMGNVERMREDWYESSGN